MPEEMTSCGYCGEGDDFAICPHCGTDYCNDCASDGTCPVCGEEVDVP